NLTAIDAASLEKIAQFVREGGALIATRRSPETAYGLFNREENRRRVKQLVSEIFGAVPSGASLHFNAYGKGRAALAGDEQGSLRETLSRLAPPDVTFREPCPHVGFVHRRTDHADIYFLANTNVEPVNLRARFRSARPYATRWDLRTGEIFEAPSSFDGDDLLAPLGPFESCAIVFTSQPVLARRAHRVETNGRHAIKFGRALKDEIVSGLPAPLKLAAPWCVTFRPPLSKTMTLERLASWTEISEARYFSGVGIYETEFDLPVLPDRTGALLKLGRVCETAAVSVNGSPAGVAWMNPYELDVTKLLRAGKNGLRIEVSNLLINKALGDGPIDYSDVRKRFGNRFPAGEEWTVVREPRVSGLLGPVKLAFYRDLFG